MITLNFFKGLADGAVKLSAILSFLESSQYNDNACIALDEFKELFKDVKYAEQAMAIKSFLGSSKYNPNANLAVDKVIEIGAEDEKKLGFQKFLTKYFKTNKDRAPATSSSPKIAEKLEGCAPKEQTV